MLADQKNFAAIDIGSNTFRLMIAKVASADADTPWHMVHYTHDIIRLGEGLHHTGTLSDAAMQRGMVAFQHYADLLVQHQVAVDDVLPVATAAMREATNGDVFRQQVMDETGIDIQIIAGEKEAAMSLAGCCAVLQADTRNDFLLFDIGGASTEFIRAVERDSADAHASMDTHAFIDTISRKMGVVRLVEAHLHSDPPSVADYRALLDAAQLHLAAVEAFWGDGKVPKALVGTAGTVTTLAATALDLCPYDADVINNYSMSSAEFAALRDRLLAMSQSQRQSVRSIEQGRADLIVAGLAIVEAVMQRWGFEDLIIVDAGLLEGAWLQVSTASNGVFRQ